MARRKMAELGSVIELWRYPASSLAGERQDAISVGLETIDGDRLYGLVDVSDNEIARPDRDAKWHKVPRIRTRLSNDRKLEIAVPDGDWLAAPARNATAPSRPISASPPRSGRSIRTARQAIPAR